MVWALAVWLDICEYVGRHHPKAFCHLLAKMLPLQISADVTNAVIATVNIVSVPSDSYLSAADVNRLRAPALVEHEPADRGLTCDNRNSG